MSMPMPTMTPALRKFALTAHVTSSVGWFGAVASFLALALAGLTSSNEQTVRAAYLAMELTGWVVIVPLAIASLLTGLVQSLGTAWGLFRHYWVVAKLLLTLLATALLLVHMQPVGHLADAVLAASLAHGELAGLRIQMVADAAAALVALLTAVALSIYKPSGLTEYGRRRLRGALPGAGVTAEARGSRFPETAPRWVKAAWIVVLTLVLLFILRHLGSGGLGQHGP